MTCLGNTLACVYREKCTNTSIVGLYILTVLLEKRYTSCRLFIQYILNLGIHLIEYPKAVKNEWIDSVCINREKSEKYVLSQKCKFKKSMNIIYVKVSDT